MNKKILSWLESLMEEEALGLAPNPYQEAMKKNIAEQATAQAVQEVAQPTAPVVPGKIIFTDNLYTRDAVSKDLNNFYLFGDNTDDRLNTHYIPTQTQAVIRGLPNAIGIDTKHNRGWDMSSFLSDADFDSMQEHYNNQFKLIEDKLKEGHNVIIPRAGIGTGKAQLPNKAPRIFEDINNRISNLYNVYNKGKASTNILNTVPSNEELLKHLYTSSFFNKDTGQMPNNYSISRSQPKGFAYPELANLAPSKELLNAYKYNNLPWEEYTKQYNDYLEKNKEQIINTINSLESDAILNCWEGSNNPKCHRHLLADWLNKNGKFNVEEYINKNEQLSSKLAKPKDLGEAQFKVISGGQTGIDILGVQLAKEYGLPTGGTIGMYPNGKYVIEADDAIDRSQFGFTTTDNTYYPYRTSQNVQNSDGTIYFKTDDDSRGYQATRREAMKYNKPFLENPASVDDAYKFITDNNIKTLNIAGNRGSKLPSELRLSTEELLRALFSKFKK